MDQVDDQAEMGYSSRFMLGRLGQMTDVLLRPREQGYGSKCYGQAALIQQKNRKNSRTDRTDVWSQRRPKW